MNIKIQPTHIMQRKLNNKKIIMLTAYDYNQALLLDSTEVDIILVGDSLGNMFLGYENTIPVTIEQMIYHTQAVCKGVKRALVVADMPFLSYHVSAKQAKKNAGLLIKEGGAQAVKMEVYSSSLDHIKAVVDIGIAVIGHVGFTPQTIHKLGGYKVQGKTKKEADLILNTAKELEKIGCFAIILEMLPNTLAKKISESINIPTIGIGAGPGCDGQVLVTHDLVGMNESFTPKFVKKYAAVNDIIKKAIKSFTKDVQSGAFPDNEHFF